MHYADYKTMLSPQNGMNLYRGCTHGCIYCNSRSVCYQMRPEPAAHIRHAAGSAIGRKSQGAGSDGGDIIPLRALEGESPMTYENVSPAIFLSRPNRFIAHALLGDDCVRLQPSGKNCVVVALKAGKTTVRVSAGNMRSHFLIFLRLRNEEGELLSLSRFFISHHFPIFVQFLAEWPTIF
jgi:hypothetical protein